MSWVKAASTICFRPFSLEQSVRGLVEAGFDTIELSAVKDSVEHLDPDDLSAAAVRNTELLLSRYGVNPVSISGHSELVSSDGMARHRRVLKAAGELGVRAMLTYIDGRASGAAEWTAFRKNLHRLADEAQTMGITLCLENHSRNIATAHDAAHVISGLGHPGLRLNYDTGNASYLAGVRPESDVRHGLDVLGHVHLKDQLGGKGNLAFPPLGDGDLDVPRFLSEITAGQFTGPVSLEVEVCGDATWPDWDQCVAGVARSKIYWDSISSVAGE